MAKKKVRKKKKAGASKKKPKKKHPAGGPKKKKWNGTRTKRKHRPELIGDSYQADISDLKTIRKMAKKKGISKAEIVRYGVKLAIRVYEARAAGEKTLTLILDVKTDDD